MELAESPQRHTHVNAPSLVLIAPRTSLNLVKQPATSGGAFRSVMLEIFDETLTAFHREDTNASASTKRPVQLAIPSHEALESIGAIHAGLQTNPISNQRLRYRMFDLLAVLAENDLTFAPLSAITTGDLLRKLLGESPDDSWTTRRAAAELAMSEATLRRRLAKEDSRFDRILLEVRMHHAMALLQTTDWSVAQVAQASGYTSRARFSERFEDRFGQRPSLVR